MFANKRTTGTIAVIAATALVGATSVPASAQASAPPQLRVVKTISANFVGPLQFAVNGRKIVVADSFTSMLTQVGVSRPIATNPGEGHDLSGVAIDPRTGAIAYTTSTAVGEEGVHTAAALTIKRTGHPDVVADLFKFEQTHNPDRIFTYGVQGRITSCVRKALDAAHIPLHYKGQLDSHPYAVTALGGGAWAVADAGGNDILRVQPNGTIFTLAVIPPQPVKITAGFAASNGLPACVVGTTYTFESVPTDVEVGPAGNLYASILPGGPEGPDSGNLGSVYRVPSTGYGPVRRVATGFASATNLAIDGAGRMFVAELGSGQIAQVVHGKPVPVLSLPGVIGVEFDHGHLYASTAPAVLSDGSGPPAPGTIVLLGR